MKVRMITTACGPNGNYHPDVEYDVPPETAHEWVRGGFAVFVGQPPAETAAASTHGETADLPGAKGKGK